MGVLQRQAEAKRGGKSGKGGGTTNEGSPFARISIPSVPELGDGWATTEAIDAIAACLAAGVFMSLSYVKSSQAIRVGLIKDDFKDNAQVSITDAEKCLDMWQAIREWAIEQEGFSQDIYNALKRP